MPFASVKLNPGINVELSPTLNESSWSSCNLIRFFNGLPQKLGGWQRLSSTPTVGIANCMHEWADLLGNPYIAIGSEQRLQLFVGGNLVDITPIRQTDNITPSFTTSIGSNIVTVNDAANGSLVNDWVNILVPVSVGGLVLQGFYQIVTEVTSGQYTIKAAANATANATAAGAVPYFTSTSTQTTLSVLLNNHGLAAGGVFTVQVATTVGGIALTAYGQYSILSVTDTNNFVIQTGIAASSSTSVYENSGNAEIQYLIHTGYASNVSLSGYGIGNYGAGNYGEGGTSQLTETISQWTLDNFGQNLVACRAGGPIYVWTPPFTNGNVAVPITGTDVPETVNFIFVANPQQMIIALGCDPIGGGTQDPDLVRFCDVGYYTDWAPTTSNQAGSYRIPSGSQLIGGCTTPNFLALWTDIDMWQMTYLGAPLVWGFTKIAEGCPLLGPLSFGVFQSVVVWASSNNFFLFDGNTARVIPCPVWDIFFNNLNRTQSTKTHCAINSWFAEASWYFVSTTAPNPGSILCTNMYVKYNIRENVWDYGVLQRRCWVDAGVLGAPIGIDSSGLLQQHEVTPDADGQPMISWIQSGNFSISEGSEFTFVERLIGDFVITGGNQQMYITVLTQDYPSDSMISYGPYNWTQSGYGGKGYTIIRARGRVAAINIQSQDLGVFWRLGNIRYSGSAAGRR